MWGSGPAPGGITASTIEYCPQVVAPVLMNLNFSAAGVKILNVLKSGGTYGNVNAADSVDFTLVTTSTTVITSDRVNSST